MYPGCTFQWRPDCQIADTSGVYLLTVLLPTQAPGGKIGGHAAHGVLIGDQTEEVISAQGEQRDIGERRDRCCAWHIAQKADLAEDFARTLGAQHDPVVADPHLARLDEVEAVRDAA